LDLVSDFIKRYGKEFDFYEQACRLAAQLIDSNLQSAGVRAIVTSRAKSIRPLEAKVRHRQVKKQYDSIERIYEDVADLAGVRVALYFPGQRKEVNSFIKSLFTIIEEPKEFPDKAPSSYMKRFSGYGATHYRVQIKEENLTSSQIRFSNAKIEIQVASVLMHAWSEVEHDLVYKPMQGTLSEDEYAILDELNGLVLAGEIALERLQRAMERRVSEHGRKYSTHYDLAASLVDMAREKFDVRNFDEHQVGRVDLLFELLNELSLNTPDHIRSYVSAFHFDLDRRPLAEQVIDQVIAGNSDRYMVFEKIRTIGMSTFATISSEEAIKKRHESASKFIKLWVDLEVFINNYAEINGAARLSPLRVLRILNKDIPPDILMHISELGRFRNQLVHGKEPFDFETIDLYTEDIKKATKELHEFLQDAEPPPIK